MLSHLFLTILPNPPIGTVPAIAQEGVTFLSVWLARIGGLVAFVGAIKFALGVRSDEANEMINGLITMISGFMVMAVVSGTGINLFDAFGASGAEAEFAELIDFIGGWGAALGGAIAFVGAIMFALSIREENAATKVIGLKTMAAGFIATATSLALSVFVS